MDSLAWRAGREKLASQDLMDNQEIKDPEVKLLEFSLPN